MRLFGKFMSWLDEENNEKTCEITLGNYNGVPMVW